VKASLKRSVRRRCGIAASVAAAAACMVLGAVTIYRSGDFVPDAMPDVAYCYLNGRAITDLDEAERLTRRVLDGVQSDIEHSAEMLATLSILAK
ncbi:MAG: hypothetical protein K2J31_04900, partial [Alistipes sp.]|nr:hypothetical protein [Alistipes sp.]